MNPKLLTFALLLLLAGYAGAEALEVEISTAIFNPSLISTGDFFVSSKEGMHYIRPLGNIVIRNNNYPWKDETFRVLRSTDSKYTLAISTNLKKSEQLPVNVEISSIPNMDGVSVKIIPEEATVSSETYTYEQIFFTIDCIYKRKIKVEGKDVEIYQFDRNYDWTGISRNDERNYIPFMIQKGCHCTDTKTRQYIERRVSVYRIKDDLSGEYGVNEDLGEEKP